MPSALEEFRTQRIAVQEVHAQLADVGGLLRTLRDEVTQFAQDHDLRALLEQERAWLARAEVLVRDVRTVREMEIARPWRAAVWRRSIAAIMFALAAAAACGAGYAWATRPYEAQVVNLRERVAFLDVVAQRVITMTPAERRQFDALMARPRPEPKPGR